MSASLESHPALVLNADYRPLSYFPLSVWHWQDAVKASFQERVQVIATYDRMISSPGMQIQLPSVIALREYIHLDRRPAFTRMNVFLRDNFTCQYCHSGFKAENLTFDHIVPRSRGGKTTWENIVTACQSCNLAKGSRSLRDTPFRLMREPQQPNSYQLYEAGRAFPRGDLHQSWLDYLYWDTELER